MGVFEPDILNDAVGQRRRVAPAERKLMVAILADAMECFRKNLAARTSRRRRLFLEAERWILSEDHDWVFSFRNICDVLEFDPQALREQAEAWKRHHFSAGAAPGRLSAVH